LSEPAAGPGVETPWLVVIDPQAIFASADSPWGSPYFAQAMVNIGRLADAFEDRVIITRWLPTADRDTSWGAYFAAWPFADVPADDPLYALVPDAAVLMPRAIIDRPTFGKWGPELQALTGPAPHLVLTGVSTDCCVISTALPAADAGATVTVVADACAGSTAENQAAALHVMGLYPPQITVSDTAAVLASQN
jgi:nicotinamidase-related amidase